MGQTYAQISDSRLGVQSDHSDDSTEGRLHEACSDTGRRRNGNLIRVHLIFVFCMLKDSAGQIEEECSYLPVTIDMEQRCMIVKVWNQHGIIQESRPQIQLDKIYSIVEENLELELTTIERLIRRMYCMT